MLTRLRVNGFKNLVDADIRFGPFTCVVGANGVGKSNLFDAIRFLSSLADKPFVDAAKCVRDESHRTGEVRALFHQRAGGSMDRMKFVAEMIVPREGVDQLGLPVKASTTFLRYTLELGFVPSGRDQLGDRLELLSEELTFVKPAEYVEALPFGASDDWTRSAVVLKDNKARRSYYISTPKSHPAGATLIYMHSDGNVRKKAGRPADQLNRTLLSAATSLESPTVSLARLEMQSWRLLQLEPSSLRAPDEFGAEKQLGADGSHLPATLYRLAHGPTPPDRPPGPENAYARVGKRLQQLIEDIRQLDIDLDEKRQLLTLIATDGRGVKLPARALSDGTLRFLALSVLEEDEDAVGVLCFEEPENGIHPARIPAMLQLLQDIAVDTGVAVGPGNPLRQVIVNSHSPLVLNEVPQDSLLGAVSEEYRSGSEVTKRVNFLPLRETWRAGLKPAGRTLSMGNLHSYLAPASSQPPSPPPVAGHALTPAVKRVRDRDDIRSVRRSLFDELEAE